MIDFEDDYTGDYKGRDIQTALAEAREMVDTILTPPDRTPLEDREEIARKTVRNFRDHINKGFLEYRKSVTEASNFAMTEWTGKGSILVDALDRVRETNFDLVLLDLLMPGLDGFSTCKAMRAGRVYLAYTLGGGTVLLLAVAWLQGIAGPVSFTERGALLAVIERHPTQLKVLSRRLALCCARRLSWSSP